MRNNFVPEIPAQVFRGTEVNLAPVQESRKLFFHIEQAEEPRDMSRFKLNQYIDIALRPKIVAKNGYEKQKFPYVIPLAKIVNLVFGHENFFVLHLLFPRSVHFQYTRFTNN